MKKFLVLISFLLFSGFCFAQTHTGMVEVDTTVDGSKLEEANADLSQIEIDFCDRVGEKNIEYILSPKGKQDICLHATNSSDKDIEINIEFVDGTFTNDQRKNKACMDAGKNENFGQYVTGYSSSFVVPANNILFQHAQFQLPKQSSGTIYGCLVYYTKSVKMGDSASFSILMRKAKFIDITISPKVQSLKFKAIGLIFGLILLMIFFSKFNQKKIKKNRL